MTKKWRLVAALSVSLAIANESSALEIVQRIGTDVVFFTEKMKLKNVPVEIPEVIVAEFVNGKRTEFSTLEQETNNWVNFTFPFKADVVKKKETFRFKDDNWERGVDFSVVSQGKTSWLRTFSIFILPLILCIAVAYNNQKSESGVYPFLFFLLSIIFTPVMSKLLLDTESLSYSIFAFFIAGGVSGSYAVHKCDFSGKAFVFLFTCMVMIFIYIISVFAIDYGWYTEYFVYLFLLTPFSYGLANFLRKIVSLFRKDDSSNPAELAKCA